MQSATRNRKLSGWAVMLFIAVLVVIALAVNQYNHSQQQRNIDHGTDDFIEAVDP
jgi:hypothetical protein